MYLNVAVPNKLGVINTRELITTVHQCTLFSQIICTLDSELDSNLKCLGPVFTPQINLPLTLMGDQLPNN